MTFRQRPIPTRLPQPYFLIVGHFLDRLIDLNQASLTLESGGFSRANNLVSFSLWLVDGRAWPATLWFGIIAHPIAEWIANQITEAWGWEQAPRYLIRDRDRANGEAFIRKLRSMGICDRPTSPLLHGKTDMLNG
jgi:hypothetical protein